MTIREYKCSEPPRVLKVKKLVPEAVLPQKANPSDSGYDLVAIDDGQWNDSGTYIEYRTGIAVEVPQGYDIQLRARSSISKYELVLCNGVGTVDNGYRGELLFRFKYVSANLPLGIPKLVYKKGDKIGQIIIGKVPDFSVEEVETLSGTERGQGGFGSTGN